MNRISTRNEKRFLTDLHCQALLEVRVSFLFDTAMLDSSQSWLAEVIGASAEALPM